MIKQIYHTVKACIKDKHNIYNKTYSDFSGISLGIKQGEPLSSLLFILFVNDVKKNYQFVRSNRN